MSRMARSLALFALLAYAGAGSLPCLGPVRGARGPAHAAAHDAGARAPHAGQEHGAHAAARGVTRGRADHRAQARSHGAAENAIAAPCTCGCDAPRAAGGHMARSGDALPPARVAAVPRGAAPRAPRAEPRVAAVDPAPIDHVPLHS